MFTSAQSVHYLDRGKGSSALLFVHGWNGCCELWNSVIGEFADHRVIAIDLPGHGLSEKPHVKYTMELFAASISAVMEKAQVERAVIVGHSMGAVVARQFYRLFPAKVSGLVVVDGSLIPRPRREWEKMLLPFRANYSVAVNQAAQNLTSSIKQSAIREVICSSMLSTPEHVARSALESMTDPAIWRKYPIRIPVLAIMAEAPWWPSDLKLRYAKIASDLEFHMWTGVSHFLMMERPKEFCDVVRAFHQARIVIRPRSTS